MKGDFSRWTFKAAKHYAAVLEQQGRVATDPDWNESVAISQHLRETTTRDVVGASGVPKYGGGFEIEVVTDTSGDPKTNLSISPGRIYVDGLLCELEKSDAQNGKTLFTKQQDLVGAKLKPVHGQTDLVYLDVWRRHVSVIEDPDLREVALGGPDTTTRLHTVWQVRLLENVGKVTCGGDIGDWSTLVAGSKGTLTATLKPALGDEPCSVEPGGGYTGLENHLYRVEIHDAAKGNKPATFKWSRDNGSVAVAAEGFPAAKKVTVARLGWDDVMAFHEGDWVEVLDDDTELAGVPGTLAKIDHIDPANRVLTLDQSVDSNQLTRHPRVRRWDQSGQAIEVKIATEIELEHGLRVKFGGSGFRTGDYWLIAARVGQGNEAGILLDPPDDAPPLGVRHHYCRLALVTWKKKDTDLFEAEKLETCVPDFPPLTELPTAGASCCTVSVGDGVHSVGDYSDIQKAIDAAGADAQVCVLPGEYQLEKTLTVSKDGLTLSGCGRGARIVAPPGAPALVATSRWNVQLKGLRIEASSKTGAVRLESCEPVWIEECRIENKPITAATEFPETVPPGPAMVVSAGENVYVRGNVLLGSPALSIQSEDTEIRENFCAGGGVWIRDGSSSARVADNRIENGSGPGIALGGLASGEKPASSATGVLSIRIDGNRIRAMGGSGISTLAPAADQPLGDVEDVAIRDNRIAGCALEDEDSTYDDEAGGGIVLRGASGVVIHANEIVDNGIDRKSPSCGVFVHSCRGVEITGNRVVNNGSLEPGDDVKPYQAGIVALNIWEGVPAQSSTSSDIAAAPLATGLAAARIHDNTVHCPKGHALILWAVGPVSVVSNSFSSQDEYRQRLLPQLAACVLILNFGLPPGFAVAGLGETVAVHSEDAAGVGMAEVGMQPADFTAFPDGRVLFHGNQVMLRLPAGGGNVPPAVTILSGDDVAIQDNQIQAVVARAILADLFVMGGTVRLTDNRITELPGGAALSYLGWGAWHLATGNQAAHCLWVLGPNAIATPNHVLFPSALCAE